MILNNITLLVGHSDRFHSTFLVSMSVFGLCSCAGFVLNLVVMANLCRATRLSNEAKLLLYNSAACGLVSAANMFYRCVYIIMRHERLPIFSASDCALYYLSGGMFGYHMMFTVLAVGWERWVATHRILANQHADTNSATTNQQTGHAINKYGVLLLTTTWVMTLGIAILSLCGSVANNDKVDPVLWCYPAFTALNTWPRAILMTIVGTYFIGAPLFFELSGWRMQQILHDFSTTKHNMLDVRMELKRTTKLLYALRWSVRCYTLMTLLMIPARYVQFAVNEEDRLVLQPTIVLFIDMYLDFRVIVSMFILLPCGILFNVEPSGAILRRMFCCSKKVGVQGSPDSAVAGIYFTALSKQWTVAFQNAQKHAGA